MRAAKMLSAHDLQLIVLALTYLEETGRAMSEMQGSKRCCRITHADARALAVQDAPNSIQQAKIAWPPTLIGGPARCAWMPKRRINRSMPTGETVMSRSASRAAAQAIAPRMSSAVAELENCPSDVAAGWLRSIAAKRESSQMQGIAGRGWAVEQLRENLAQQIRLRGG
jgi:hypothetical protein